MQFLCQCFCGIYTIQKPQCVLEFITQFRRRERELILFCHGIQESVYRIIINKFTRGIGREEFIQVKSIFCCFSVNLNALRQLVLDNLGHLICEHIELRKLAIRVLLSGFCYKLALCLLFISICPVVDCLLVKLIIRQSLERRAGQMERILTMNPVKGHIRLIGIHALVSLVNYKDIPDHWMFLGAADFVQFIILTTKVQRSLQILQGYKFNAAAELVFRCAYCDFAIFISGNNIRLSLYAVYGAHKMIAGLHAYEFLVVLIPAVGDSRTIGDN